MDNRALSGLRGLLAFHIMTFHVLNMFFKGSSYYVFIFGELHMPLFFILSGFCLVLAYGNTHWTSITSCCSRIQRAKSQETNYLGNCDDDQKIFDVVEFYKKRLARILPLHYLGILAGSIIR